MGDYSPEAGQELRESAWRDSLGGPGADGGEALHTGVSERLVRRCLAKDSEDRYYSMHDVVLDLRTPLEETTAASTKTNRWPLVLAAVMTVAALAVSVVHFREIKQQPRLIKIPRQG